MEHVKLSSGFWQELCNGSGVRRQNVALQDHYLIETLGECPRGREPTHACADHNGLLADPS